MPIISTVRVSKFGICEVLFSEYMKIQASGAYNMLTDAPVVANALGIDLSTYIEILRNYSALLKEFY